jgi:mRNA interferase RelE/StbE
MYSLEFTPSAIKELKRLPKNIQKQIIKKLEYFLSTPNPLLFANHLINFELGEYRFRIRDYRVIFDLDDEKIIILSLGHRKNIYR